MISAEQLDALEPQMRQAMLSLVCELQAQLQAKDELIARHDREAAFKQALIDKLTHENAMLKRLKFAATSERFASTLAPEQSIRPAKSPCHHPLRKGCSCPLHFIADTWTLRASSYQAGGRVAGTRRSSEPRLCRPADSRACPSRAWRWPTA